MEEKFDARKFVDDKLEEYKTWTPEQLRAHSLKVVNEMRAQNGDAPLDRLMTHEEVEAAYQARIHPPKNTFFRRLKKAWRVLTETDD